MKIVDIHIPFSKEKCKFFKVFDVSFFLTPEIDFENEP